MDQLLIRPDKQYFTHQLTLLVFAFILFISIFYIKAALSITTFLLITAVCFLIGGYLYASSKRTILIDKTANIIEVSQHNLFRKQNKQTFSINQFNSIRSYISRSRFPDHIVELVTTDNNRALTLAYFQPCSNKKFWTLITEVENPKAQILVKKIENFLPIENLGFVGHKFTTTQIGIEDNKISKGISGMFKK